MRTWDSTRSAVGGTGTGTIALPGSIPATCAPPSPSSGFAPSAIALELRQSLQFLHCSQLLGPIAARRGSNLPPAKNLSETLRPRIVDLTPRSVDNRIRPRRNRDAGGSVDTVWYPEDLGNRIDCEDPGHRRKRLEVGLGWIRLRGSSQKVAFYFVVG